jgi:hypothetical protein
MLLLRNIIMFDFNPSSHQKQRVLVSEVIFGHEGITSFMRLKISRSGRPVKQSHTEKRDLKIMWSKGNILILIW